MLFRSQFELGNVPAALATAANAAAPMPAGQSSAKLANGYVVFVEPIPGTPDRVTVRIVMAVNTDDVSLWGTDASGNYIDLVANAGTTGVSATVYGPLRGTTPQYELNPPAGAMVTIMDSAGNFVPTPLVNTDYYAFYNVPVNQLEDRKSVV